MAKLFSHVLIIGRLKKKKKKSVIKMDVFYWSVRQDVAVLPLKKKYIFWIIYGKKKINSRSPRTSSYINMTVERIIKYVWLEFHVTRFPDVF